MWNKVPSFNLTSQEHLSSGEPGFGSDSVTTTDAILGKNHNFHWPQSPPLQNGSNKLPRVVEREQRPFCVSGWSKPLSTLYKIIIKWDYTHIVYIVYILSVQFSSVQLLSCVWLFVTPWIAALQASLSITNSRSSLKLTSIELVMPSSHLVLCHPLLLLPPIPLSIRVFSNESTLHMRWPKYWSFSFSIIPSKGHPGLISFRMDWLDLLAVQGTLKSLLQALAIPSLSSISKTL